MTNEANGPTALMLAKIALEKISKSIIVNDEQFGPYSEPSSDARLATEALAAIAASEQAEGMRSGEWCNDKSLTEKATDLVEIIHGKYTKNEMRVALLSCFLTIRDSTIASVSGGKDD